MAVEALLSLALESSSAERPSTSRRLTSLPSVAPTMAPLRVHHQHHLGLRVVPAGDRMQARLHAVADGRHRLRLGEDLGVRADADLQVLRPRALLDQHALELCRLLAAGHELARCRRRAGPARCCGSPRPSRARPAPAPRSRAPASTAGNVTPAALIACRSIGRQQPRLLGIALRLRRVGEDVVERADALPLARRARSPPHRQPRARSRMVGARREMSQTPSPRTATTDGPADLGPPHAPGQRARRAVLRQRRLRRHASPQRVPCVPPAQPGLKTSRWARVRWRETTAAVC